MLELLIYGALPLAVVVVGISSMRRLEAHIQENYSRTILTPLVAGIATAFLIVPTVFYLIAYDRCGGPDDLVTWLVIGSISFTVAVLGWRNITQLRLVDAILVTALQSVLLVTLLAVASFPVLFYEALSEGVHSARHNWCR